jgi:hypothetical protein
LTLEGKVNHKETCCMIGELCVYKMNRGEFFSLDVDRPLTDFGDVEWEMTGELANSTSPKEIATFSADSWRIIHKEKRYVNTLPKNTQNELFEKVKNVKITGRTENQKETFEEFQERLVDMTSLIFIPYDIVENYFQVQLKEASQLVSTTKKELSQSITRKVQTSYYVPANLVPSEAACEVDTQLQANLSAQEERLTMLNSFKFKRQEKFNLFFDELRDEHLVKLSSRLEKTGD